MASLLDRLGHSRVLARLSAETRAPISGREPRVVAPAPAQASARRPASEPRGGSTHGFVHVATPWCLRPGARDRAPLRFGEPIHERPRVLGGALDRLALPEPASLAEALALLAPALASPSRPVFLDGETTGLDGVPFVLGLAHVEVDTLIVEQWTLERLDAERAMLADVFARLVELGPTPLVTYNGASFDLPLLRRRAVHWGLATEALAGEHLDLLHAARRLAGDRVDDHRLATLEREWLDVHRRDDLPSHEIPRVYEAWLANPDDAAARGRLRAVVVHNQADLVTLPALAARLAARLEAPDDLAMATNAARLLIRHGRVERARALLEPWIERARPGVAWREALACLAELERRAGRAEQAAACWRRILVREPGEPDASHALAKLLEHQLGELDEALQVACRSREPDSARIARLERKLGQARASAPVRVAEPVRTSEPSLPAEPERAAEPVRVRASEPARAAEPVRAVEPAPAWQASVALRFAPWHREAPKPEAPKHQAAKHEPGKREPASLDDDRPRTTYRLFIR